MTIYLFASRVPLIPTINADGTAVSVPDWDRKPDLWIASDGRIVVREEDVPDDGSWTAVYLMAVAQEKA
jgi:hypothetical protein